jgi:hypothetical protein
MIIETPVLGQTKSQKKEPRLGLSFAILEINLSDLYFPPTENHIDRLYTI